MASTLGFNTSIAAAVRQGHEQQAGQLFEELLRSQCRPDAVTYSLLIKACSRDRWWKTLEYLAMMQTLKHDQHDIVPYAAAMSFLNKLAKWQASLQVFQVARQQQIVADTRLFAAAFTACRLGAAWELSICFLQNAKSSRIPLDDVGRNGLVSALVRGSQVATAMDFAENVANINSMLMSLSQRHRESSGTAWAWTLHILERFPKLRISPTLGSFKAAASTSKDRPDMVLPILETLKTLDLPPLDETALNMLLTSLERCHRWQDALFHLWAHPGLVELASYNSVISACSKVARWEFALRLADEIPKADEITFGSLVSACYRGHWSLALHLLYQSRLQNIRPNRIMVHSAIVSCEGQRWPWSLYLFEESLSWRVSPDSTLVGAVISSCEKGHQWARCLDLLSRSIDKLRCPPDLPMLTTSISAMAKSHRWEHALELVHQART